MGGARLLVEDLPHRGAGAKRYAVRCSWTVSHAAVIPSEDQTVSRERMVTLALLKHARECGRCDLSPLWVHADLELRARIERAMCSPDPRRLPERRN